MPHSRTEMELNSISRYLRSPDGINAVTVALNAGKDILRVPLEDGTKASIKYYYYFKIRGEKNSVYFDQYNELGTSKLFIPKYETEADRTEERMHLILSFVAYAFATTVPAKKHKSMFAHYIKEAKKLMITNVEDYLLDRKCRQWNAFVDDLKGRRFVAN